MADGVSMDFDAGIVTPSEGKIRRLKDIPDIQKMIIPPRQWLVPGLISRASVTMWAGVPGAAKSYLILRMAIAVASGTEFLGRQCVQCPVLILDYENTDYEVQKRLALMTGETYVPNLYVWGIWNEDPARIGNDIIMGIAEESKPLIVFDPFRNAHGCDENSSTEMTAIMQQLTYLKKLGATVIFAHHPGKGENATSRGSSAIDGAVDLALVQTLDADSQRIELKANKNKIGELFHIFIRPDFEAGTFEATESEQFIRMTADIKKLKDIIAQHPTGISQNRVIEQSGMMTKRAISLLRDWTGTHWDMLPGKNRSKIYNPLECFSDLRNTQRNIETPREQVPGVSCVSPLKGRETQKHPIGDTCSGISTDTRPSEKPNGRVLPSCPVCGGYALYHGECQTCSGGEM